MKSASEVAMTTVSDPNLIYAFAVKVADRLIGQCMQDLDQVTEELGDELSIPLELRRSSEFSATIDDLCFCCDGCGWWCSTEELNNEGPEDLCDDCNE